MGAGPPLGTKVVTRGADDRGMEQEHPQEVTTEGRTMVFMTPTDTNQRNRISEYSPNEWVHKPTLTSGYHLLSCSRTNTFMI